MIMFSKNIKFPEAEEEILNYWQETKSFEECMKDSKERPEFIFYDGPPFATGLPHYGHILSGTIKDTIGRFWHQQGYKVSRRFGWDCHGLPVEYEIDKKLGITDRNQILEMGIGKYNDECKNIVMKYSSEWEKTVLRMGRWVDFRNGYKTMDKSFMESTWFIFKQLWIRNKIYRGHKIMPFSTACKTPLSNFESNQNYKDVSDPSVLIAFPLLKPLKDKNLNLVAWTTTPWTLPANCALIVNKDFKYGIFSLKGIYYAMHADRIDDYFKDAKIIEYINGSELVGLEYSQPFDFFENLRAKRFFRVLSANFVSDQNGTAIVHCAPAFGEEDYKVFVAEGLIQINDAVPCPVDENGCFTIGKYKGIYVKDLDKIILSDIKDRVLMNNRIVHSYPFCWRSDTPLIYKLVPNWFVRVKDSVDSLLKNNEEINWVPEDIKFKRFHNWLGQARDWAISRNRFWGTPIPIWATENYEDMICIGSIAELEALSNVKITDLHRQYIDDIVIIKDGKKYKRIDEVLDCWFESGSMPYAQDHWPFNTEKDISDYFSEMNIKNRFLNKSGFPAQFIGEGLDQTRGWFYTLHVLSTLLFDKPAFQNVIVNGIVLAEDGKKMSKRLKNYPDPHDIFNKYGADSLRMYLLSSPVVEANNLRFSENGVKEIMKILMIPWYNSLSFLMECKRGSQYIEMDTWITASFNNCCFNITSAVKSYRLNTILGFALKFLDDLSNWYIRINRKQLRLGCDLLAQLLKDFSIVMAPFIPFFSEYCYQCITNSSGSVHQCLCPTTKSSSHPFETAKKVIEGFRQIRDNLKLKLKRPIKLAKIVCSESMKQTLLNYNENIKVECNLLDLEFEDFSKYFFIMNAKPYFDNLKKDMGSMKQKISIISGLNESQINDLIQNETITSNGMIIKRSDVLISKNFVNVPDSAYFDEFGIVLDTEMNDHIMKLAESREFYSFLQKQRKNLGLSINDVVFITVSDDYLKSIVSEIYPDVLFGVGKELIGEAEYSYNDQVCKINLFKN